MLSRLDWSVRHSREKGGFSDVINPHNKRTQAVESDRETRMWYTSVAPQIDKPLKFVEIMAEEFHILFQLLRIGYSFTATDKFSLPSVRKQIIGRR